MSVSNPARCRGPVSEWWNHEVPAAIIGTYRRIPDEKRTRWSMGSSSSHLAAANPSWETLLHYGTPTINLTDSKAAPKLDRIDPGWDSPKPPYPGGKLKMFMIGWVKLAVALPLITLSLSDGQGSWKIGTSLDANPHTGFIWGE